MNLLSPAWSYCQREKGRGLTRWQKTETLVLFEELCYWLRAKNTQIQSHHKHGDLPHVWASGSLGDMYNSPEGS